MAPQAPAQTIYLDVAKQATITCPTCQKSKAIDTAKYQGAFGPAKVRCPCGNTFYILLQGACGPPETALTSPSAVTKPPTLSQDITTQRVYAASDNHGTIVCPRCQHSKRVNVSRYLDTHSPAKVKCACGHVFAIIVDTRKFYRKRTHLKGHFADQILDKWEEMVIKNLSLSGIGFTTQRKNSVELGEIIRIRFRLDNASQAEIRKVAIVRQIRGSFVGAEFQDITEYEKELGRYLQP